MIPKNTIKKYGLHLSQTQTIFNNITITYDNQLLYNISQPIGEGYSLNQTSQAIFKEQ